jgi:ribokinase
MGHSMSQSVLVAGSANLDLVVRAPRVPAPGETVLGRDFARYPGGKGANQAVAAARAGGIPTRMLLALGDDANAQPLEASLRDAGVDCTIVRSDRPTGVALICVADDGENAIIVASGANAALQPSDLPALDGVACLLLQLESPLDATTAWARAAREAGIRVVLNAAPAPGGGLPDALLAAVDVLVVNEGELAAIAAARGADAGEGIAAQLARTGVGCVVVTLGGLGAAAKDRDAWHLQPGFEVAVVDTTGAGDTFCGVLAACLARGDGFEAALRRACAASALACTRPGAQTAVPAQTEVDALLAGRCDDAAARTRLAAYVGIMT